MSNTNWDLLNFNRVTVKMYNILEANFQLCLKKSLEICQSLQVEGGPIFLSINFRSLKKLTLNNCLSSNL